MAIDILSYKFSPVLPVMKAIDITDTSIENIVDGDLAALPKPFYCGNCHSSNKYDCVCLFD